MDRSEPVAPRPAATVVVARPAPEGVEVLMLRRGPRSRFGAGFAVFPGGSIDPADDGLAERWFGAKEERARACAVRELIEEASIALTAEGPRPLERTESGLDAVDAAPPPPESLPEIARWVAPEFLEVRFDARFFGVAAPADLEARPDGLEIDRAWWASPRAVLAEHALWETLMWPTFNTLKELAGCSSVDEVLSMRMEQVPPPVAGP
jgi:8-oxo-dGTP pyrophosphatase MutT (NUDIX family)